MDDQIITPILGDPESADPGLIAGTSHLQASCLRRLFFECYTAAMFHLKRKAEATDHTEPRKLSQAEKAQPRSRFDARGITGFKSRGRFDPSDHYLERMTHLMHHGDGGLRLQGHAVGKCDHPVGPARQGQRYGQERFGLLARDFPAA